MLLYHTNRTWFFYVTCRVFHCYVHKSTRKISLVEIYNLFEENMYNGIFCLVSLDSLNSFKFVEHIQFSKEPYINKSQLLKVNFK